MNDNADVEIFMKSLLNKSGSNVDQEYLEIHNEYKKMFGHIVSTEILPSNISDEQIKKAMMSCIENHTDNILDILNVAIDDDVLY